jgi:hypothetical protein
LKLTTDAIITHRKGRRMASVLDVVLKSTKVPTLVSTKASEDNIEKLVVAAARSKPVEQAKENLLEES